MAGCSSSTSTSTSTSSSGRSLLLVLLLALVCLASVFTVSYSVGCTAAQKKRLKGCCIDWKKPTKVKTYNIKVGDSCTWVWTDALAHCVTFKRPNPENFKGTPQHTLRGFSYTHKFTKPGTYKISCCVHIAFMRTIIKVAAKKRTLLAEQPARIAAGYSGKCYSTGSESSWAYPPRRTRKACQACCTIGRSSYAAGVQACIEQCTQE